jgi:maltoporin
MGFGMSSEKGRQVCFQAPGAPSKFRLGNECDQYGEFHFAAPIYVAKDGMVATAHFMPAVYIPTSTLGYQNPNGNIGSGFGEGWNGAAWGFPFMYMDMQNVPGLSGGTPWVGRRYYKREDWHSTDFFYWNPSGLGAGIEDINLGGELRLSYAAFSVDAPGVKAAANLPALAPQNALGIRNDIQLRGIRLYPGGELQAGLNLVANWSDNPDSHPGWGVTVRHVQDVLNGSNKLAFQYGQGSGSTFGIPDALSLNKDNTRLRIVDVLTIDPTDWFGVQAGLIYEHQKSADSSQDWISAGARGSFAFSEHGKIILDIGHDNVKPKDADAMSVTKFTIAPALSGGRGVMTRPELRLFCTVATWNAAARDSAAGVDSAGIYKGTDKKMGATFGVHSEVWW